MGIFSRSEKESNLEQYLKSFVGEYYKKVPEAQRKILLERIVSEAKNKKYVANEKIS